MEKKRVAILMILFACLLAKMAQAQPAQNRFDLLGAKLDEYSLENPKMDKEIDIAITGTLQELAIAFSKETKLNLLIDPSINPKVVVNFAETRPRDILLHLCKFYNLDLSFSGTIITMIPFSDPPKVPSSREIDVKYNAYNDRLELNLRQDTLDQVVKKISIVTGKNVIVTKTASNEIVSGYIGQASLLEAMQQMARRNDLIVTEQEEGYFIFDKNHPQTLAASKDNLSGDGRPNTNAPNKAAGGRQGQKNTIQNLKLSLTPDSLLGSLITVDAVDVSITDIIKQASEETGQSYFFFSLPDERISFSIENVTFDQLLAHMMRGSKHTFKNEGGIYIIGERTLEGLRQSKVLQLQHRSAKDILQLIPKDVSGSLQVQEFIDLNSLVLSGSAVSIAEVEQFVKEIDKPVPVVMIELLIVDFRSDSEVRIGLEAGMAADPPVSGGSLYPSVDFTFSSKAINKLLSLLAGNGIVNLGRVQPNFYASLQAVEDNGFAKVLSKPRLSTINGKEAKLSIGETRYYQVERTTLQGNQTPISLQERRFESVNADFTITITPVVSGDESVTLSVTVSQSDFLGQIQANAPPPQVNRSFTSNIRLYDHDMIVLGGLESKGIEDSGTGLPWVSRVPVLKWFFSKRRKAKSKSQLLIFVRPNVIW